MAALLGTALERRVLQFDSKGLTQARIAAKVGVSVGYVNAVLRSRKRRVGAIQKTDGRRIRVRAS